MCSLLAKERNLLLVGISENKKKCLGQTSSMNLTKKFFNSTVLSAQRIEFLNFKQDNMTIVEAVNKFERLAKLCPYLVPTEEQRIKRMLEMF